MTFFYSFTSARLFRSRPCCGKMPGTGRGAAPAGRVAPGAACRPGARLRLKRKEGCGPCAAPAGKRPAHWRLTVANGQWRPPRRRRRGKGLSGNSSEIETATRPARQRRAGVVRVIHKTRRPLRAASGPLAFARRRAGGLFILAGAAALSGCETPSAPRCGQQHNRARRGAGPARSALPPLSRAGSGNPAL